MHFLYPMCRSRCWTLPKSCSLRKCRDFPLAVLPLFALLCGCGGGSVSQQPPPVPPTITTQPANQRVTAGQTATFTVVAAGTAPLSYQWQKNGVNVAGATSASYTTPATTTSDSGSTFAVVVSNTAGTVTSATATLTVNAASAGASIAYVSASGTSCAASTASTGSACTLTSSTTSGSTVIVGISWRTTTVSIAKVVGSASSSFFVPYAQYVNGTGTASAILVCLNCASLTTVTPTFSGSTKYVLNVAEYSGVSAMGITGIALNTGTSPGLTFTTGDSNDFIVCETASAGSASPTSGTGNLREANNAGSSGVVGALIDNTIASAGSVSCTATISSGIWSASGIELRTTSAKTYIWPDCDSTHPCLIYYYARPAMPLEAIGPLFKFWVRPSLASNLLVLTITHPGTISSIVDAGSNTWAQGATATSNGYTTDVRYVCGAAAGSGGEIDITLSSDIAVSDIMQVDYDEYSGITTSSCSDGTSSATALSAGAMNPGSITTTQNGDLIYTFGIDASANQENGYPSGREMPDDSSANIWDSMLENFISTIRVQASSGAINPTLYVAGMDIGEQSTQWQLVAQAFKATSGAGTQPPSGHAWPVRDLVAWNSPATGLTLAYVAGPTNGNAIVFDSTNYQSILDLTTLNDNQSGTYTVNPVTDTTADPEQYVNCMGSGGGVNRDRTFSFAISGAMSHTVHYLDIAGAKTSGGSTGCIGNGSAHHPGTQAVVSNSNVVTSSSEFSTPFSFTPTLNGTAYSVVVFDMGFGTGPPSGPCNSGGVTPPSCTNDMTPFVFGSVWATNMGDGSHYTTGDAYGWYSTNSATATSFDFFMANSVGQPGGGTSADAAALEILGQPAAAAGDVTGLI